MIYTPLLTEVIIVVCAAVFSFSFSFFFLEKKENSPFVLGSPKERTKVRLASNGIAKS
jgi:hypothetical protein